MSDLHRELEKYRGKFLYLGNDLHCESGVGIDDITKTWIGSNVTIRQGVGLATYFQGNKKQTMRIKIGDRVYLGRNTIIESFNQVIIEEDVLIGPSAYISDSQHEYKNPNLPIVYQSAQSIDNILTIKRGVWIGSKVTLIGNLTIGYGSVVGANSVVTTDIPSHCVVFGSPAKILKIYHYKEAKWIEPSTQEEFISILNKRGKFSGYDNRLIAELVKSYS